MNKQLIKSKINANIKIEDSDIEFSILEAKDYIINYCNRNDIPSNLDITILKLVIDLINFDNKSSDTEEIDDNVKSISQGDTNITFKDKNKEKREDIFKKYHSKFNKFRMVRK